MTAMETKIVGKRRGLPSTPEEAYHRALVLQAQADQLNPYPKPRGFVFKARSYAEYKEWRRRQTNPRLW
jgi:hypothetical protein